MKTVLILPAFNAAKTLPAFLNNLPRGVFDHIILVDDSSSDKTFVLAKQLALRQKNLHVYKTLRNVGYGGNLKYCLTLALEKGADVIVELHPDGEYLSDGIVPALAAVKQGANLVLGNRFSVEKKERGMLWWKIPVIRSLNTLHNLFLGTHIPDLHQGFRVYTRGLLEKVPYRENENSFLFSFQIILRALFFKFQIASVPVSTYYRGKKRGATTGHSFRYAFATFRAVLEYYQAGIGHRGKAFQKTGMLPACVFCKTDALVTKREVQGKFSVSFCSQCLIGSTYPSPKSLSEYYPRSYWQYEGVLGGIREKIFLFFQNRRVEWVRDRLKQGSVLDVGSGEGKFGERLGGKYRVTNIEEQTAKVQNPAVLKTNFLTYTPRKKFDAVTFWESLEHVSRPEDYLKKVYALLRPGGFLFVEYPRYQGLESRIFGSHWFHLDMPRHTFHFTPFGLELLLERCGFVIQRHGAVLAIEYGPWGMYASLISALGISEKKVRESVLLCLLTSPLLLLSIALTCILYFFHQSSIVLVVAKKS